MLDQQTKDRISWWAIKARSKRDPFIKFILYWFCFNAWITNLSNKDSDSEAIDWFIKNENCLKDVIDDFWDSSKTQSILKDLQKCSPIYDMRPGHRNRKVELKNINDIGQVVRYIYQIRCNLFHGSKNPMNERNKDLVGSSSKILGKWIEWADVKCENKINKNLTGGINRNI